MRKDNDVKVLEFTVRPEVGAARLALSMTPVGYHFWKLRRKGTKAKVYFVKD